MLNDPTTISTRQQLASAALRLGVELVMFDAQNRDEVSREIDAITAAKVEAVNVLASPILTGARQMIIDRLDEARLPAIYQFPEAAADGGLLAYGPRLLLCYRHVVSLADKILRGARPTDLPIEQPSIFELVLNLKAAHGIGLTFSPQLLLRADNVIE